MPPPPRAKLYAKTGKLAKINHSSTLPPSLVTPSTSNSNNTSETDSDSHIQFELELCWCIQTMETSLQSGKLNEKMAKDTQKTINILKSSSQPMVKKRQVMRAAFGDYRAKMTDEEKKMRIKNKDIHFVTPTAKSYFVKKSSIQTLGKAFKFNFSADQLKLDQIELNEKNEIQNNDDAGTNGTSPPKSMPIVTGETFKFNFVIE